MSLQQFLYLFGKQLANEASETELLQLKQLAEQHPDWQKTYEALLAVPQDTVTEEDMLKAEQAYALHSVKLQIHKASTVVTYRKKPSVFNRSRAVAAVAAVVCAACIITWALFVHSVSATSKTSQVMAKRGARQKVTLPDGSVVNINADSKLEYNNHFAEKTREVWLTGEAFFEVAKQAGTPFIIHTGNINIKVLGTSFNVKSYPDDATVETSLIQGKVQVSFEDRPDESIILHPNEKLTVKNKQSHARRAIADTLSQASITVNNLNPLQHAGQIPETAWLQNTIAFSNASLSEIAMMLERHFDVTVEFANPDVMYYRYTGIFEEEELSKILAVMKLSKPFNYNIDGKKITITH